MTERSRFERWWAAFAATFNCPPTTVWRDLAWSAWQASKET